MLKLIIGNKRYSSWSMRPWIAMRELGVPFDEEVIPLYRDESKAALLAYSPAGKAPVLKDGELSVWDSLAIIEYLADLYPDLAVWPRDRFSRALARSLACEMHSGYAALRGQCPMNFGRAPHPISLTEEARIDVERIDSVWRDALARSGGPFLFGAFCSVDAMFAPVVQRFDSYAAPVSDTARVYMERVTALNSWAEWSFAAQREEWRLERFERA
ncbi:MAG TPA: glutathione S-transferase family protein [Methylocystis sp.]